MTHRTASVALAAAAALAAAGAAQAAFPAPIQANPSAEFIAHVPVDYQNVMSYSYPLGFDPIFFPQPRLYWFKYTSNGRTALKLDTLGSTFGTGGGGPVLGSSNQSQVAIYTAAGQKVGISKGTKDLDGNPIPIYPTYSNNPDLWYHAQGLSEVYLANDIPLRNPHWDADPNDPVPFTAWAAPGNEGNSQKYFPPHYPVALNEYHVWHTALSTVMLDMDGNPVINTTTGQPRPQPGWRYYDRARHGLGTPWNRFEQLPAGEYYFAIASSDPVFAGDTYVEEVLRAPVHFDPQTQQVNQPKLNGPLGTFQYYIETTGSINYGTIAFNVTQTPAAANLVWAGTQAGGLWDVGATQNWKNGALDDAFLTGDNVIFDDSSTQGTVNLTAVAPGVVSVLADARDYTFSGAGAVGGAARLVKNGDAILTLANAPNTYTGGTEVLRGRVDVIAGSAIGPGDLAVGPAGEVRFAAGRTSAVRVTSASTTGTGRIDLASNDMVVDYSGDTPVQTIRQAIAAGYAGGAWTGGGIATSSGDAGSLGLGYAESSAVFTSFPAVFGGQTVDDTAVLIAFTRFGDSNLDGTTDIGDFARLAGNFNQPGLWQDGDNNYDGSVNIADFALLAANFNQSAPLGRSSVPEPAMGMALLAAAMFLRRRSR